jgi:hypothetical protein
MGWSRPDEEFRADHDRDERKNDFPPIDRLERPLSTAEDICALVKLTPNFANAAKLIDQYADMKVACALHDDAVRRLLLIEAPLVKPADIIFGGDNAKA